jgi:hypothetical protein
MRALIDEVSFVENGKVAHMTLATDVDSVCNRNAFLPDWKNLGPG